MITRPSVVSGSGEEVHVLQNGGGKSAREQGLYFVRLGSNDQEGLANRYFVGEANEGVGHLSEHVVPIGVGVRPGKLHGALGRPLCGEHTLRTGFLTFDIGGALHVFEVQFGGAAETGLGRESF